MTQANGHHGNGHGGSGISVKEDGSRQPPATPPLSPDSNFDQAIILRQPPKWSRGIAWSLIGITSASIIWAAIARIEQVVPARGQLKPQGTVKEIQAPVNGVVKEVAVKDGDRVEEGQPLVLMDATASQAELESLKRVRRSLQQENQFYQALMQEGSLDRDEIESAILRLKLPREVASLARNRTALAAENDLFRIQMGRADGRSKLDAEERARLRAAREELASRSGAARLEVDQLQKQLAQTRVQLADAREQLAVDRASLTQIQARNEQAMAEAEKSLAIDRKILQDIEPLLEEGALAEYQVNKQKQSINDRYQRLIEQRANGRVEYHRQDQQVQSRLADIQRFREEEQRLLFAIDQAQARLTNTFNLTEKDVRDRIAENQKRIAEIDSQLTKVLVENQKRIAELDSEISRTEVTIKYQALKAPVSGTVFDLKASPGYVPPPNQSEPLLKIVPDDHLIAEVDITNEDIGFVRQGMKADVRIDTFPFSEFGDIKGTVSSIGSDALPPDEIHQYYRFPAKIELDRQVLAAGDREIPLQSGMAVSANIKVRENRTVLSLFTELFTKRVETLKEVR